MQTYQLDFLALIRHYFFQEPIDEILAYDFLYTLARDQHLIPMIYESCRELDHFKQADPAIQTQMRISAIGQIITQQQYDHELERINECFKQDGLKPLVLKGRICRETYPQPDYRCSADEDLLIKTEDYPRYAKILTANGYICQARAEVDETILKHSQTINFTNHHLTLELHIHPFGTNHELHQRMNRYFLDSCDHPYYSEPFYTLQPTEHYLFLIFHLYKHFLSAGVGVRQLLDLLLYKKAYADKIDMAFIDQALEDMHITKLYDALMQCGDTYLHFPYEKPKFKQKLEPLMENLLVSGCTGGFSATQAYSSAFTNSMVSRSEGNRLSQIGYLLFPSLGRMQKVYPVLKEHPKRLPIYWCKRYRRIFRKILHKDFDVNESLSIAKQREKLYRQYDIFGR